MQVVNKEASSFEITSGQLLYGQYPCLVNGYNSLEFDSPSNRAELKEHHPDDTLIYRKYNYKVKAKNGKYVVYKLLEDTYLLGYVVCLESIDLMKYLIMIKNEDNTSILTIGRYDWGYLYCDENYQKFEELVYKEINKKFSTMYSNKITVEKVSYNNDIYPQWRHSRYCVLLEPQYFEKLPACLLNNLKLFDEHNNNTFVDTNKSVGVHLTNENETDDGYEYGWLCFDEEEEFVMMVYSNITDFGDSFEVEKIDRDTNQIYLI